MIPSSEAMSFGLLLGAVNDNVQGSDVAFEGKILDHRLVVLKAVPQSRLVHQIMSLGERVAISVDRP
jgi:hypothetical protein